MLNLSSLLDFKDIANIATLTEQRYKDHNKFKAPDALLLYEQGFMDEEELVKLCSEHYGQELRSPKQGFVPKKVIDYYRGKGLVPINYSIKTNTVTLIILPELYVPEVKTIFNLETYKKDIVYTTPSYYFKCYSEKYGQHEELLKLPVKEVFEAIKNEAIQIGAADVTMSTFEDKATIYYNVRKTKVYSRRVITARDLEDIVTMITIKDPMDTVSREPKYVDVALNDKYRGRVLINHKFKGIVVTMRLLPQGYVDNQLSDLSLTDGTVNFLREVFLNTKNGLRIIGGPTMSGKNTTCLSVLKEVVDTDRFKVVSIEMPVEQIIQNVEQISASNEKEYGDNIRTLIHQNPDFIYIAEIRDTTGKDTMYVTNTGKRVLSTLHFNSCSDVVSRLVDITALSPERIIQTLHSVVYQELVRDNETDTVAPRCRYIEFTDELKDRLYGNSVGEIASILREEEDGDIWISSTSIL